MGTKSYSIDISRHHADEDKDYYLIFSGLSFTPSESGFRFKLYPLTNAEHRSVHQSKYSTEKTILINERLIHLYELIQKPYSLGVESQIESEFKTRTVTINGKQMKLWQSIDSGRMISDIVIQKWIKRWEESKKWNNNKGMNIDEFLKKFYPDFYQHKYLSFMKDLELFTRNSPNCKNPDFWEWYVTKYLGDNNYPVIY